MPDILKYFQAVSLAIGIGFLLRIGWAVGARAAAWLGFPDAPVAQVTIHNPPGMFSLSADRDTRGYIQPIGVCTRAHGHDGPCNGYPCASRN